MVDFNYELVLVLSGVQELRSSGVHFKFFSFLVLKFLSSLPYDLRTSEPYCQSNRRTRRIRRGVT